MSTVPKNPPPLPAGMDNPWYDYAPYPKRPKLNWPRNALYKSERDALHMEGAGGASSISATSPRVLTVGLRLHGLVQESAMGVVYQLDEQLQVQLAIRAVLDNVSVKRSGKDAGSRPALLAALLEAADASEVIVSDRGVRWGRLAEFGAGG